MHSTSQRIIILGFSSLIIAITPFKQLAHAQSTPPSGVTIPPNTPERIEETIPKPTEIPLPSIPEPSKPPLQVPTDTPKSPITPNNKLINLKQIKVLGSTVLSDEINQLIKKYENCSKQTCFVTFEDLHQLSFDISKLYIDRGYVTSTAFIPTNQLLDNGIVKIQVVEGKLKSIEISGLNRLQENYVRSRLTRFIKPPLNEKRLKEGLQLLQLNPLIKEGGVKARLDPGNDEGTSILQVQLQEAPAFSAGIVIDNNQSPTIGSLQGIVFATNNNLLGFGDQLIAEYGLTEGLDIYSVGYRIPINASDGTFNIGYSNNNSQIVEDQFADLGIRSDSKTITFGLRQPLVKKNNTEFALGLAFDLRHSQTFLLGDPYSFPGGPENGKSRVRIIRFSQELLRQNPTQLFAARSQFSFGIDAFDATINNTGIDGRFIAWLGQVQLVKQLLPSKTLMLVKINAQLTPDALLPLENISLGGVDTVRGYRQNQLVADNGVNASVELRFPLTSDKLQIRPFFDIGTVWNHRRENADSKTIAGLGLGLSWQPQDNLFLQIDYGIPLIAVEDEGNSLQENGLYFSLRYQPF